MSTSISRVTWIGVKVMLIDSKRTQKVGITYLNCGYIWHRHTQIGTDPLNGQDMDNLLTN